MAAFIIPEKTFLLLFTDNERKLLRLPLRRILDQIPEINDWYALFPNAIFIRSSCTAEQLQGAFVRYMAPHFGAAFLITDLGNDMSGNLPQDLWAMLGQAGP